MEISEYYSSGMCYKLCVCVCLFVLYSEQTFIMLCSCASTMFDKFILISQELC